MRIEVILDVEITHDAARFRVHCMQVVALIESLYANFPVRAPFTAHVADDAHFFDFVVL